jgi:erythromycin esterase-like protein
MDPKLAFENGGMTDADVAVVRSHLMRLVESKKCDADELEKIYSEYYKHCMGVVDLITRSTKDESELIELDQLKRIIRICTVDEIFIRTWAKIWKMRDNIMAKRADWFLGQDFKHIIKPDRKQVFLETLVAMAKNRHRHMTPEQHEIYWKKGYSMMGCIARFVKIVDVHI